MGRGEEIAAELWGFERERLVEIANSTRFLTFDVAPMRAVELGLVRPVVYTNDTLGHSTIAWEATDLGREVAAALSKETEG